MLLLLLFHQPAPFGIADILETRDPIQCNLMKVGNFLLLISLILLDLELNGVEDRYENLILLLDDFLIGSEPMQHIKIITLVHQRLCMQPVVVLC